jgi:hypothetical protein
MANGQDILDQLLPVTGQTSSAATTAAPNISLQDLSTLLPAKTTQQQPAQQTQQQPAQQGQSGADQIVASLNDHLGGVLAGHGQTFVDAGKKYGVDPKLLAGISIFETGNGTSNMAKEKNNIAGLYDSKAKEYRSFSSVADSIEFHARNLRTNYLDQGLNTIEDIAKQYAPVGAANDPNDTNAQWPGAVSRITASLGGPKTAGTPIFGQESNQEVQKLPASFGMRVATPEFVNLYNAHVQNGGDPNQIPIYDRLAVAIAKDPSFLTKPENFESFYGLVWKPMQQQSAGEQFNKAIANIGPSVQATVNNIGQSIVNTAQGTRDAAELAFRKATGQTMGQGYQDLVKRFAAEQATMSQGLGTTVSDTWDFLTNLYNGAIQVTHPVANLFVHDAKSQEEIDRQYAQAAQQTAAAQQKIAQLGKTLQDFSAAAYTTVGAYSDVGQKIQQATPNEAAVQGYSTVLNPLNYVGLGEGAAAVDALKPIFFEKGLQAAEDVAGSMARKEVLDTTQILPKNPELSSANTGYIETRNLQAKFAPATRAAAQDLEDKSAILNQHLTRLGKIAGDPDTASGIASSMLQAGGQALEMAGGIAQKASDFPEWLGGKLSGGNPIVKSIFTEAANKFIFGVALHHLGPVGGVLEAGLEHLPDVADSFGAFLQATGKELRYGQATIPYWTRVAQQTKMMPKFLATALDSPLIQTATAVAKGGAAGAAAGAVVGGVAGAGSPSGGGGIAGAVQGAAFGGLQGMAGGGFGQWMKFQNPNQYLLQARGDWKRYRDTLSPKDLTNFHQLSPTNQLMLAQNAQHFPGLVVDYSNNPNGPRGNHFVDNVGNSHIQVNTANPDSAIRGILAHELTHATASSGTLPNLYDSLLGNPQRGIIGQYTALQPEGPGFAFSPSSNYQEVPEWAAVPPGGEYKVNMATGKTEARWDKPPGPEAVIDKRTGKAQTQTISADAGKPIGVDPTTGRYIPNQEFNNLKNQYTNALSQSGVPVSHLTDLDIAREIHAEHGVDYLLSGGGILDSNSAFRPGLLSKNALKTAMAKMGFTFNDQGSVVGSPGGPQVTGTGLFADLQKNPDLNQLVKSYYQSGWRDGKINSEEVPTTRFTKSDLQKPNVAETLTNSSEILRKSDGTVMRDKNTGLPLYRTPKQVEEYNANFAQALHKGLDSLPEDQRMAIGYRRDGNNVFMRYLPDNVIDSLAGTNQYNPHQIASLRLLSRTLADAASPGMEMRLFYHKALTAGKTYRGFEGTEKIAVPYGLEITGQNNVNIKSVDFGQLTNNYLKMRNKAPFKDLWASPDEFTQDAHTYFTNHSKGDPGATAIGIKKRDAINSLANFGTQLHQDSNPLVGSLPKSVQPIIKSYRIDRANQITATGTMRPFVSEEQYRRMNQNYLPKK